MKRLLSIMLSLVLLLGLAPTRAFASPDPDSGSSRATSADRSVHSSIVIDDDPEGGYEGNYVVIYNPSTTPDQDYSTGIMTGLIETTVDTNGQSDSRAAVPQNGDYPYYSVDVDAYMEELAKTAEPAPAPKDTRTSYKAGDKKTFSIYADWSPTGSGNVEFKCLYVGSHCYIWTPTSTASNIYPLDSLGSSFAKTAANEFDSKFNLMQSSFGNHDNGSNGDGKVHLLYYNIVGDMSASVAGFFYSPDLDNNGLPMLNIDTYPIIHYTDSAGVEHNEIDKTYNVMVHEYQHLINHSNTDGMDTWLNESFSAAAEEICYPGSSVVGRIQAWENYKYNKNNDWLSPPSEFAYQPSYSTHRGYSMYAWSNYLTDVLAQYGQVSLFAQYLYTRFGNTIYRQISDKYSDSTTAAITSATGVNCADLVRNFRVALTANASQNQYGGIYGFKAQPGYDPTEYHNVQNPYSLLAPIIFTGKSCAISGGGAITVKPVGGVYNPPSDADSGLRYIGVTIVGGTSRPLSGAVSIPTSAHEGRVVAASFTGYVANISPSIRNYQWQRKVNGNWIDIAGTDSFLYVVSSADINHDIRVVVTADGYTGSLTSGSCYCTDSIPLTEAYFPDPYFRQYLNDKYNTNGNSWLEGSEISKITGLYLYKSEENYYNVASLEGVQYLTELEEIYANHTQITSFNGTGLDTLYTLDLSECPLDTLVLTTNDQLRKLRLADLTGSLDELDLSGLPNLMVLETYGSDIDDLDISKNPYLVDAALYGTVTTYTRFTCYQIDRFNYLSTDEYDSNVTVAHFDEAFPCARLRSILQGDRNINWDGNNYLSIAEAKDVKSVDVGDEMEDVYDLRGVELLPNLDYLAAFTCDVSEVDLSRNTKLKTLDLDNNKIDYLDVSHNTALEVMYCCRNGMGDLILGCNDVMFLLYASENYLIHVDVSDLPALRYLDLDLNLLWDLDVTQNANLEYLDVDYNYLNELNLSKNMALKSLSCIHNGLTELNISACPKLISAYKGTRTEYTDEDGYAYWQYKDGDGNVLCVDKETKIITAKPAITTQPKNQTVAAGEKATFTVKATGGSLSYQWWYRTSSTGTWTKVKNNGTSAKYTLTTAERHNGYQYRCRVSNAAGSVYSGIRTLTVVTKPAITTQPKNQTVAAGEKATFTVKATGGSLTYQWYYRTGSGGEWKAVSAASGKTATYTLTTAARHNGYQYRCLVKNAAGKVYSSIVKLTVK